MQTSLQTVYVNGRDETTYSNAALPALDGIAPAIAESAAL